MKHQGRILALTVAILAGTAGAQVMGGQQPGGYPGGTGAGQHIPGVGEPGMGGSDQTPGIGTTQKTTIPTVDDDTLMRQVHEQLARSEEFKNVTPSVHMGVVTLQGTVPRKEDRKQAKQTVAGIPGVVGVKEKLSVKPESEATSAGTSSPQTTPSSGIGATNAETTNNTAGSISGNASAASGTQAGTASMGQTGASTSSAPSTNPGTTPGSNAGSTTNPATPRTGNDQQVSSGVAMSDNETLRAQIQNALQGDPNLRNDNISVAVSNDSIELGGTVQNGKSKQAARAIAESYAGSRKVVDHLTMK